MGSTAGTEKLDYGDCIFREVPERPLNAASQINKPQDKKSVAVGDIVTTDSNDRSTCPAAPDEGEPSYSGCTDEYIRSARQSMRIIITSVCQFISDKITHDHVS